MNLNDTSESQAFWCYIDFYEKKNNKWLIFLQYNTVYISFWYMYMYIYMYLYQAYAIVILNFCYWKIMNFKWG